jgi:hypothetical protein
MKERGLCHDPNATYRLYPSRRKRVASSRRSASPPRPPRASGSSCIAPPSNRFLAVPGRRQARGLIVLPPVPCDARLFRRVRAFSVTRSVRRTAAPFGSASSTTPPNHSDRRGGEAEGPRPAGGRRVVLHPTGRRVRVIASMNRTLSLDSMSFPRPETSARGR